MLSYHAIQMCVEAVVYTLNSAARTRTGHAKEDDKILRTLRPLQFNNGYEEADRCPRWAKCRHLHVRA